MATELATAYVSLLPSAQGFGRKLTQELDGIMPKAGQKAGDDAQKGFAAGFGAKARLAAVGVAAAAIVSKSFADALDIGKANDKLAAQLGASGQFAEDLGKISGELYANAYGDSVADVNEALRAVLQNGLLAEDATNEQIEGITAKVLDLAAAFDQDVGGAAAAVSQLIRTGLASDADEALDIITRGFQQGADKSGDLLDTFTEYGTQFRKLGIEGPQATGLLLQGLKAGARDADVVADAIKEFSIRAIDGSEATGEAFKDLGVDGAKMAKAIAKGGPEANEALDETLDRLRAIEDPVKRSQIAVGLFGTQAEDLGDALYALDLDTAAQGLGDIAGAAEAMGTTLNDNAATKIEAFKRQALGGLTEFIGNTVIPGVESLVALFQEEGLAGVVSRVGDAFNDALPGIVSGLGNIASALGEWITTNAPIFAEKLLTLGAELYNWVAPQIPTLLEELGTMLVDVGEWILRDGVPLLVDGIGALGSAFIDWVADDAIPGLLGKDGALWDLIDDIATWIEDDAGPAFLRFGKDLGEALVDGLVEAFKDLPTPLEVLLDIAGGDPTIEKRIADIEGRATGGPVNAGQPYIVGDGGRPELFVPSTNGYIVPQVPDGFGGGGLIGQLHVTQLPGEDPVERAFREARRMRLLGAA